VWDPEAKGAGAEDYQGGHKLIIKHALLGPEATDGNNAISLRFHSSDFTVF